MGYENREREHRDWIDEFGTFEIGWDVIGKWDGATLGNRPKSGYRVLGCVVGGKGSKYWCLVYIDINE